METFLERGPKRYCGRKHRVRASQERTGRRLKGDALRQAAIERDGGCVRRLRPEQIKTDDDLNQMHEFEVLRYFRTECKGKLMVRRIDPTKPRTPENVETLCGRHFGKRSDEMFRERIGPERYRETKKAQARQYHRLRAMRRKMIRIYKGPPKNPLDFIDYI